MQNENENRNYRPFSNQSGRGLGRYDGHENKTAPNLLWPLWSLKIMKPGYEFQQTSVRPLRLAGSFATFAPVTTKHNKPL
jgi:hypothetical protein